MTLTLSSFAEPGIINKMEQALMPGDLSRAHEKFEKDCSQCHKFFGKAFQNDLCLSCHDHKNVASDIKKGKGFHGKIPDIKTRLCKTCHREHIGREAKIIFLDEQTFDHNATDYPLTGMHAHLPCKNCHEKSRKYHEASHKCYDCHRKSEPHKGKLGKQCNSCHITKSWQDFHFDHSQTRFKLDGKHNGVLCRDCHPQERYTNVPINCFGCHSNDDKHQGRLGKKCKECHSTFGWTSKQFNHDKDTKFKLEGKHRSLSCQQCHKENPYKKKIKTQCYSCHKLDDDHKGSFGKKCEDCHDSRQWKKTRFDHSKTDFPLIGKHEHVNCKSCHPGNVYDKLPIKCYDCHQLNDPHEGQQGKKCISCHNPNGWFIKIEFDHNITRFPLLGAHQSLSCEECHDSSNFKEAKIKCHSCHSADDYHEQKLGTSCQHCHFTSDWKAWEFDHNKQTDFILQDSHKGIDCTACHLKPMAEEIELSKQCYGCHSQDDAHDGGFGRNCRRCHKETKFDDIKL